MHHRVGADCSPLLIYPPLFPPFIASSCSSPYCSCYNETNHWNALTDGKIKYVFRAFFADEQLFNLTSDPWEMRNLAPLSDQDPGVKAALALWRGRMVKQFQEQGRGPDWVKDGVLQRRTQQQTYSPNYPHPPAPASGDGVFAFPCNRNGDDGYVQPGNQVMNATAVATTEAGDPIIKLTLSSDPTLCLTVSEGQPLPGDTTELRFGTCGGTGGAAQSGRGDPLPTQRFVHASNGGQTGPLQTAASGTTGAAPQCVQPLQAISGEDVRVVVGACGAAGSDAAAWQEWVFGLSGYFFLKKDGDCMSSIHPTWGALGHGAGRPWQEGDPLPAP